jgi:hypothetical protein
MPFDGLPEGLVSDLVKLRVALDGVRKSWGTDRLGLEGDAEHCAIGWLLVASDWDEAVATQLALDYVYPVLPERARAVKGGRLEAIWRYNDRGGQGRIVKLFEAAVARAAGGPNPS